MKKRVYGAKREFEADVVQSAEEGNPNEVKWDQVSGHDDGHKLNGDQKQVQQGMKLYDDELIVSLPKTSKQPHDKWEDLDKHGKEGLDLLKEALGKVPVIHGIEIRHET